LPRIVEAVFENGVIKIRERLPDGERVLVILNPREKRIGKYFGLFKGKNVDEVVREIEGGSIY